MKQAIKTLACSRLLKRSPTCPRHCIARLHRPFEAFVCSTSLQRSHLNRASPGTAALRLKQTFDLSLPAPWIETNHSNERFTSTCESWSSPGMSPGTGIRHLAFGTWQAPARCLVSPGMSRLNTGLLPDYYRTTTGLLPDYYGITTGLLRYRYRKW